jgi:PAS domain S-box-containing protein
MATTEPPDCGIDDVLITAELTRRSSRDPDHAAEARALSALAEELSVNPAGVLQKCAELALDLCRADSAGISILEPGGEHGTFRWHAAAGAFAANLGGTLPREASPCGVVIARDAVLLFNRAERVFPKMKGVEPRVYENLLVPWHANGAPVGTLWALKHTPDDRFDAEDARLLQSLSRFASAAHQTVTAHNDAEERTAALRESEERFRSFADNSADTLWILNAETRRLEYLSPAFEQMWGETRARVMTDLVRWAELVHPDDRAWAQQGLPRLLAGETYTQTYRIVRPRDGSVRFIQDTGFPVRGPDDSLRWVAGIAQDVTGQIEAQRRIAKSERRLRSLMEGIPQLVWRAVDGASWTWSSPQWSAYTGLSEEASRGRGWLEAVHPEDRARALAAWQAAERGTSGLSTEYRLRRAADDCYRWFSTRATPVHDETTGERLEWLGTSTDVDDIRSLQERQKLLHAELQHRVRNTLAVMRSIVRRTGETSETVEDYAMHLDGRLNAFARTQAVVTRNPGAGVDLAHIVAEELVSYHAREGEQVRIEGPALRFCPKAAETFWLAIHELATNAVKYGALSSSRGRIAVTWSIDGEGADRRLTFRWTESGVSIDGAARRRKGFGTELLERTLAYEFGATAAIAYRPTGLHVVVDMPLTERVAVT